MKEITPQTYLHSNLHVENVPLIVDSPIFRTTHMRSDFIVCGKIGRLFFIFKHSMEEKMNISGSLS